MHEIVAVVGAPEVGLGGDPLLGVGGVLSSGPDGPEVHALMDALGEIRDHSGSGDLEEATMTTPNSADVADHRVDLEADVANEDKTGYIWGWRDEAHDGE